MSDEDKTVVLSIRVSKATWKSLDAERKTWERRSGLKVTVSDVARRRLERKVERRNGRKAAA